MLLNENDDNDFSQPFYQKSSSISKTNSYQNTNQNYMVSRNFPSSDNKGMGFMKGGLSGQDSGNSNPYGNSQNETNNPKPNYLDKIKTLNSMNSNPNSGNAFKNISSASLVRKEDSYDHNEGQMNQKFEETTITNFNPINPMQRPPSSSGLQRPGSSQSQANL